MEKPSIKRIMFVCHGNICRSPLAEFLFRDMLRRLGKDKDVFVDSSAVSPEEEGNPVYPPIKRLLADKGIDVRGKYAKTLRRDDYGKYNMFIGMDSSNIRGILRIFGSDPDSKVIKLLDLTEDGGDVADPYYYGNYDKTLSDIELGCKTLLKKI